MSTVRRVYIFLTCAMSLQAVTWAAIALLRNVLKQADKATADAVAFWIAVIIVGLPLFLVHWLWAQRLAGRDEEERGALLRRLYLYGTLGAFLTPFAVNLYNLMVTLLRLAFGLRQPAYSRFALSSPEAIIHDLTAMVVLALLWFYHQRILGQDTEAIPEKDIAATMRRWYVFGSSGAGLIVMCIGAIQLLHWIMFWIGHDPAIGESIPLTREIPRLIIGATLWAIFWRQAQQLFTGPSEEERASVLRKVYLYLTLFAAVVSVVISAAFIVHGLFERWLRLPGGDGDIRVPIAIIVWMAAVWVYHDYVLRADAAVAEEAARQATVRRIYYYIVAGVSLAAFLVGLAGDISVLIRALAGEAFVAGVKEEVAQFSAVLLAGLPVWILPWRRVQSEAVEPGPAGAEERRSVVRKIYLYLYFFAATVTVLWCVIYIVHQLLSIALGTKAPENLLIDLGLGPVISYTLIAVGVWLYHGALLRSDRRLAQRDEIERAKERALRVTVVDVGEGHFGRAVLDELRRKLPGFPLDPIGLTPRAAEAMGQVPSEAAITAQLAQAELIVGPWVITVPGEAGGAVTPEIAAAVLDSPARKLLVPVWSEKWEWAGVDRWSDEALVRQTVRAVEQVVEGKRVKLSRTLGFLPI